MTSPNYANRNTHMKLHDAIPNHYMALVKRLIGKTYTNTNRYTNLIATLKAADEEGNTPFHITAENGKAYMIEYILGLGSLAKLEYKDLYSILSTKNCDGDTIFHIAAYHDDLNIFESILSFLGKNNHISFIYNIFMYNILSIKNNLGHRPLDIAAYKKHTNIIKLFLINSNIYNDQLQTAKYWAGVFGHKDIVSLLHNQLEKIKKDYPCGMCDESFPTHTHLEEHEKECIAGKPFVSIDTITKTGKIWYYCIVCFKPYDNKSNLRVHHRMHTGEKPFECYWQECGKHFSQQGDLKRHIRIHTKEKSSNVIDAIQDSGQDCL